MSLLTLQEVKVKVQGQNRRTKYCSRNNSVVV